MPKKNFQNFGELQQYEYVPGVIDAVDCETDTCTVTVGEHSYAEAPIFYHCAPDAEKRENGALKGAAAGFAQGDEVVVLRQRSGEKCFVIGHMGGIKYCRPGILIISSPSGDEAFAWDVIRNELYADLDTYAAVATQVSREPVLADASGTYQHTASYPLWSQVADDYGYTYVTVIEGQEDQAQTILEASSGRNFLFWRALAFGPNGDPEKDEEFNEHRKKWSTGDTVVLRTTAGSTNVELVSVNASDEAAEFDMDHVWINNGADAISQDWTFTFYIKPNSDGVRNVYITGDSYGPSIDHQYVDAGNSGYPTTSEDATTGRADWLKTMGFEYSHVRGNYAEGEEEGPIYPVVYYYQGSACSYVPYIRDQYEALTGVSPTTQNNGVMLQARAFLFYVPVFGWDYESAPLFNLLSFLARPSFNIENIFDSWRDCSISGENAVPDSDGVLNTTAGIAESGENRVVYDAYHLHQNDEHSHGLHIYCCISHQFVLTPIEQEILRLVNQERVSRDLEPVVFQLNLQWAARRHANDMVAHYEQYQELFRTTEEGTHEGTDGSMPQDRAAEEGYANHRKMWLTGHIPAAYENTGFGYNELGEYTARGFMNSWAGSAGHWANILNPDHRDMGIACKIAPDGSCFACQVFGRAGGRWPGFAPVTVDPVFMGPEAAGIQAFMDENFSWNGEGDDVRIPKIYLS